MPRKTGVYRTSQAGGETVRAFIPSPLPPNNPPMRLDEPLTQVLHDATTAVGRLAVAALMAPSADWFLFGFVRKEAVISSQIEGTQATLHDVAEFEATDRAKHPEDVQEVCNYLDALDYARRELSRPKGLPISTRLLCGAHKRLMRGVRGAEKQPGEVRGSQNWSGGGRPGPPISRRHNRTLCRKQWQHSKNGSIQTRRSPLVRAGLAHVQFETIHPFLDGNGRIGRLLVALLVEHWGMLPLPLLYLSLSLKRQQEEYYRRLSAVRSDGDWEGWTGFFLSCVTAADDGVTTAQHLFALLSKHRQDLLKQTVATVSAIRLFDLLPSHPMVTLARAIELLNTTKPTASKAIDALMKVGVLREITGKQRDRIYAYHEYLQLLTKDN
jgi:Fic family protein